MSSSTAEQVLLVFSNLPDQPLAETLARMLVEQGLAACVNILPPVQSIYRWQGKLEQASEVSLMIKTTQARYAELEAAIRAAHPYEVPEILAIPAGAGLPSYLQWVVDETKKDLNA
ncbi:divalent-cation tolerance protein CutA [Herbaspirillum lusitanum]|jgi:periplasmic divalent cation tolerance protein|uniref:Divalent-cation tolerance protein CutA n=1 Tax=Herbaspirillum lusitanum TaxID=213312 RepID=A0ABW9AHV5_9BURK